MDCKAVLATGGTDGIGKAISCEFLTAGDAAIIADIADKNGEVLLL